MTWLKHVALGAALALMPETAAWAQTTDKGNPYQGVDVSDDSLVRELPGFRSRFATVNGIRIHYVEGGKGSPVIMMPGWPQTWWAFHKLMPKLAEKHHVIAVDIRGMGASDKPRGGYDKKTMAKDINELARSLGYGRTHIVGHDIGSQVAYAYAALYPDATTSVTFLDVAAQPQITRTIPIIPGKALTGDFGKDKFLWWFAFNQIPGMPEELIEGRSFIYQDWFWGALLKRQDALTLRDRAVYANAYNSKDGIRGGNGWYQAYPQDLDDQLTYRKPSPVPVLGIGGIGNFFLVDFVKEHFANPTLEHLPDAGHYIAEEEPEKVLKSMDAFLTRIDRQRRK